MDGHVVFVGELVHRDDLASGEVLHRRIETAPHDRSQFEARRGGCTDYFAVY